MGNRLSKIYTRTGDNGTTGLAGGLRVSKDSLRMQSIGDIDELNSMLGVVVNKCPSEELSARLRENIVSIQHDLFNLGGQLAMPDYEVLNQQRTDWLEESLDQMNEKLTPLKEFILPGGAESACFCNMARTICRRAERSLVALNKEAPVSAYMLSYINRLSDWLFIASRILNKVEGEAEVYWQSERLKTLEKQRTPK
ncbi:ATP:Cob(I)alamin adenosyltransferase [hydrothermal vent metagenome]|uniref:ATP:Cob(I)alamin adenosyltransferase n=1 Tax=hydrothermal vent metagenome TaxID=652676 RepID=A0A3B0WZU1_9ZZZZ